MISDNNFSDPVYGTIWVKDKQNLLHPLYIPIYASQFQDSLLSTVSGEFLFSQENEPEPTYIGEGDAKASGLGIRYKINNGTEETHWGNSVQSSNYIKNGNVINLTDLVISNNFSFSESSPFSFKITGYKVQNQNSSSSATVNQSGYSSSFIIDSLDDFKTYDIQSLNWSGNAFIKGIEAKLVIEQVNSQNTATLTNIRLFTAKAAAAYNNWLNRNLLTKLNLNFNTATGTVKTTIDLTNLENRLQSIEERLTLLETT